MRPIIIRNKQLVKLREEDPKTYSFRKLARMFRLSVSTAFEIYQRDKRKYGKQAKKIRHK